MLKYTEVNSERCSGKECFFLLGFAACKTEKPLQGMKLQEKDKEKEENHVGKLFRKNPKIKGIY